MKIVIQTQIRENYGDVGEPYWKSKGGSTYVVENLTVSQVLKIKESGIPTLRALIETKNEGFEEYVIDWSILDDDAKVGEEWDTHTKLSWTNGRWTAGLVTENGEYGWMRREIARKVEAWDMLAGGGRENYKCHYVLRKDGRYVSSSDIEKALAA